MNSRKRSLQTLWDIHTNMYKTDDQQEPAVWHRELYSVFYNSLREKRMLKKIDTYVCIAESLFCVWKKLKTEIRKDICTPNIL